MTSDEQELTDYLTLLRTTVTPIAEARDADQTIYLNASIARSTASMLLAFGAVANAPEALDEHLPAVFREILQWHRDNAFDRAQNLGVRRPRGTDAQLGEQAYAIRQELANGGAAAQTAPRALIRRILATMVFAHGWLDDLMTRPRPGADPTVDQSVIDLVHDARAGVAQCIVVLSAVAEVDLDTEDLDD